MNKEFAKITNEQLCAIIIRLKSQLLEARFKLSLGELQKPSIIRQISKAIAQIFTEITNRGFKLSLSNNNVILYDVNTNKQSLFLSSKQLTDIINEYDKLNSKKATAKVKNVVEKETKKKTSNKPVEPVKEVK